MYVRHESNHYSLRYLAFHLARSRQWYLNALVLLLKIRFWFLQPEFRLVQLQTPLVLFQLMQQHPNQQECADLQKCLVVLQQISADLQCSLFLYQQHLTDLEQPQHLIPD